MIVTRVVHAGVDISSAFSLLTYTHSGAKPISVLPRVELGDSSKPIHGQGNVYDVTTKINGAIITPLSKLKVPAGQTEAVLMGRDVVVAIGDVVELLVTGASQDTDINVIASLFYATPAQIEDFIGTGAVVVDHNHGGTDTLTVLNGSSVAIDNVSIRAYLKADWDAGKRGDQHVVATARTNAVGQWRDPMMLDTGTYSLLFFKQGAYEPKSVEITVT